MWWQLSETKSGIDPMINRALGDLPDLRSRCVRHRVVIEEHCSEPKFESFLGYFDCRVVSDGFSNRTENWFEFSEVNICLSRLYNSLCKNLFAICAGW